MFLEGRGVGEANTCCPPPTKILCTPQVCASLESVDGGLAALHDLEDEGHALLHGAQPEVQPFNIPNVQEGLSNFIDLLIMKKMDKTYLTNKLTDRYKV